MNKLIQIYGEDFNLLKVFAIFSAILFIVFTLAIPLTSASFNYDDYELKWNFCGMLNFSGYACDLWWNGVSDLPTQQQSNYTLNISEIQIIVQESLQGYYNKSEIEHFNFTNNQTTNNQDIISILENRTTDDFEDDKRIMTERDVKEMLDSLENLFSSDDDEGFLTTDILILVAIILGICVIVFIYFIKPMLDKKYNKPAYRNPVIPLVHEPKQILSRANMQQQRDKLKTKTETNLDEIEELKQKIKEHEERQDKTK